MELLWFRNYHRTDEQLGCSACDRIVRCAVDRGEQPTGAAADRPNGLVHARRALAVDEVGAKCACFDELSILRLFTRSNLTTQAEKMWLVDGWHESTPVRIRVTFDQPRHFIGISVYNYNASLEMSYIGVSRGRHPRHTCTHVQARYCNIYIDDEPVALNVHLRKAPGHVFYDYVQDVAFEMDVTSKYDMPRMLAAGDPYAACECARVPMLDYVPITVVYQIQLLSTWGDEFYIGLNGIELFDANDQSINIRLDREYRLTHIH